MPDKYFGDPRDVDTLLNNGDIFIRAIPGEVWKLCLPVTYSVHRSHPDARTYCLVEMESERVRQGEKPRIYRGQAISDVLLPLLLHERGAKYEERNPVPQDSNIVKLDFHLKRRNRKGPIKS
jgi:hypothetical protein